MSNDGEILQLGDGYYTISDISDILQIERHKISYLVRSYWNDKLSKQRQFKYLYDTERVLAVNFLALLEINIFYILKQNGIGYKKALLAQDIFAKKFNSNYPFAHESFYISGSDILFKESGAFVKADMSRQLAIEQMIKPFSKKIEYNKDDMAIAFYPLGKEKSIVVNPEHQFGEPVIKKTNILASTIAQMHEAGDSIELISDLYKINKSSIQDAVAFYKKVA